MEEESQLTEKKKRRVNPYSRTALGLFVTGITAFAVQYLILQVIQGFSIDLEEHTILMWLVRVCPLYLFGMPAGVAVMRAVPKENLLNRTFTMQEPAAGHMVTYRTTKDLTAGELLKFFLICFPVMLVGNLIGTALSYLFSDGMAVNPLMDLIDDQLWIVFLVVVLIGPFMEEYIFRKQIIDRCGKYGERAAVIFSGVTFGLFHGNLFQFFYAMGIGLVFAYIYTRTGKLRYSVILHSMINFMGSVLAPVILKMAGIDVYSDDAGIGSNVFLNDMSVGMKVLIVYEMLYVSAVIIGIVLLILRWKHTYFLPAPEQIYGRKIIRTMCLNMGVVLFLLYCISEIIMNLVLLR